MPNDVKVEESSLAEENAPPPRSGSRVKVVLLIVVLIAAAAGAYAAYMHYRDQVSSDDAEVDGHIAAIAPKISGNVIEVLVDDNQEVKAGQVLVRIDPRDYQAKVDIAKAQVEHAESQLRSARVVVPLTDLTTESGVVGSSAQLADATAELERARLSFEQASGADLAYAEANVRLKQANNDRAQADLARMKPLADKAEISQLQYDAYLAAARVAESDLQASREKLASAQKDAAIKQAAVEAAQTRISEAQAGMANSNANRKQVDVRSADAGTAAASVDQERANLANAELQLSYTTIVSPVDGVVTRKSVEVGQVVAPGQGLMAVVPLAGHVGHGQLQGDPARRRPHRPESRNSRGYVRPERRRTRRFHRRRHRRSHEPPAARKCHRQLRQSGPAHPRENPGRQARWPGPAPGHERGRHHLHQVKGGASGQPARRPSPPPSLLCCVPLRVRRRFSALETPRDLPLIVAFRAESASIERVPAMPALAGPEVIRARRPLAFGAADAGYDRSEHLIEFGRRVHLSHPGLSSVGTSWTRRVAAGPRRPRRARFARIDEGPGRESYPGISPPPTPGAGRL